VPRSRSSSLTGLVDNVRDRSTARRFSSPSVIKKPGCTPSASRFTCASAARWRESFSRLSPLDAPRGCRGFPGDTWRHCCREILAFLDETRSPYWARIAAECGWDDIGLFGVHPVVGLARFDTAGALLTNLRGEPITQVLSGLIRFRSGIAAYRGPTNPETISIWDFRELPLS
jgi:hypothetical protein